MLGLTLRINGTANDLLLVLRADGMRFPTTPRVPPLNLSGCSGNERTLRQFRCSAACWMASHGRARAEMTGLAYCLRSGGHQGPHRHSGRNVDRAIHRRRRAADVPDGHGAPRLSFLIACARTSPTCCAAPPLAHGISVRTGAGASRGRVVRQLLESLVLGLILVKCSARAGDSRCETSSTKAIRFSRLLYWVVFTIFHYVVALVCSPASVRCVLRFGAGAAR